MLRILFGAAKAPWRPAPKRIRSKKMRRAPRPTATEAACAWPTRWRRARARLSRTARAREVARTWPSYEMARDTLTVHWVSRSQQKRETQCTELYAALRDGAHHCNRQSAACVQRASTRIKTSGASERAQKRLTTASKRTKHQARGRVYGMRLAFFYAHEEYLKEI